MRLHRRSRVRFAGLLLAPLVLVVLAGSTSCGSGASGGSPPDADAGSLSVTGDDADTVADADADTRADADAGSVLVGDSGPPPPAPSPSTAHKPVLTGLLDKGSEGPYHDGGAYSVTDPATDSYLTATAPAMSGLVVNATWSQLEPSPGVFDFTVIDGSLAALARYNQSHPDATLGVRLRVFGAYTAPAWAKTLDGPSIPTVDQETSLPQSVAQWWAPKYRSAWASLQLALAAAYDAEPMLREVAVSSCAASTAEPMVIDYDTTLAAAKQSPYDYTTDLEHACLLGAFSDYAPWAQTGIYYPVNPLAGDATVAPDILQTCAASEARGGPRCILATNALDAGVDQEPSWVPIFAGFDAAWQNAPDATWIAFQMSAPTPPTWCDAIAIAVAHHGSSVELWPPQYPTVGVATLETYRQALMTGDPPSCP